MDVFVYTAVASTTKDTMGCGGSTISLKGRNVGCGEEKQGVPLSQRLASPQDHKMRWG